MKKFNIFKRIFWVLVLLVCTNVNGANPEISKWIKNISEGEGADSTGFEDYAPELVVAGNIIHVIWITNKNWESKQLYYRRSKDSGRTWEPKKLLVDNPGLDDNSVSQKLYAYGNFVHIAYVVKEGLSNSELFYLRSDDGGESFEVPRVLYSVPHVMSFLRVRGDGSKLTIACVHACHFCSETQILHFFNSEDNGKNMTDIRLPDNLNNFWMRQWDFAVEGDNIYFFIYEGVGDWYNYDYNLHFFSSNNRGQNFRNRIISSPAQTGNHHPFDPMDGNWGYTPKIAAEGNRVWMIWSGRNAENKDRVFVRASMDGGESFEAIAEISGDIGNFAIGHESIVANGNEVYACFLTKNSRLYVAKSHDYGITFDSAYEVTIPDDRTARNTWGPKLVKGPFDKTAHIVSTGPIHGILYPQENISNNHYIGNEAIRDCRYINASFSSDGVLHIVFQGGGIWRATGWFTDYDILYRRIDANYRQTNTEDMAIRMKAKPNPGDGSGFSQFDKMTLRPSKDFDFKEALTIETWIKPDNESNYTWITHNNTITWNQSNVGGFILWPEAHSPLLPLTNIVTTTGTYPIISKMKMTLHTWNHLAVTYDKNAGAHNFRLYLNGNLVASTTAQGDIVSLPVSWIMGASNDNFFSYDGLFDELRFWNKALTQNEIQNKMFAELNGTEEGLVAYYNFNEISPEGQVADITGRGNTGYLVYLEKLEQSTIRDLKVHYSYVQEGNTLYFMEQSEEGESFEWNFGDQTSSFDANPTKVYNNPGTYQVCLTVSGIENSGTWCDQVAVKGIDRISPNIGGNTGGIIMHIFGGGFETNSTALLRKSGHDDIVAVKNVYDPNGSITAIFDLTNKSIGVWDVVIKTGISEQVLAGAFHIVKGEKAKPWVTYSGGGNYRVNRWSNQSITVGNSANVDAYGVVLWVAVPDDPDFEIVFLNLNIEKPQLAIDRGWSDLLDSMGLYVVVDSLFGKPSNSRLYSFYLPYIPARSSFIVSTRVKIGKPLPYPVQVAVSAPFYASPLSTDVQGCIAFAAVKACVKAGIGFIPGGPCIAGGFSVIADITNDSPPTPSSFEKIDVKHFGWSVGTSLLECGVSLVPGGNVVSGVLTIITSSIDAKQEHDDCLMGFWPSPFSIFQILYHGVTSDDPNEKIGPIGYGADNYIPAGNRISYQINFENKAEANAPAQEVVITDTLSNPLFDIENFSFGHVGFGDAIFYPTTESGQFGLETDLRPANNLILRITGEIDTINKIVLWRFTSLDPDTRDLPADPLTGFLPPNKIGGEGEGFISFSVGINEVQHDDFVENKATIIFDENKAIQTNVFLNSFDLIPPESRIKSKSPTVIDTSFVLNVNGSDVGSGIRLYEVYVSENYSEFVLDRYISADSFIFTGKLGNNYRFYSIAMDSVGNRESKTSVPDVEVSIISRTIDKINWEGIKVYPAPASSILIIEFLLPVQDQISISIIDISGREVKRFDNAEINVGAKTLSLNIASLPDGYYNLIIRDGNLQTQKKVIIVK